MSKLDADIVEKYEKILARDPRSKLFAPLAEAYRERGDFDQATALAQQGIQFHPEYIGGYLVLGRILNQKKIFAEAITILQKAVSLSPDNILAYQLLGDAYLASKLTAEAIKAHKMALFLNPLNEKSRRIIEKLESHTAEEFEDEIFQIRTLQEPVSTMPSQTNIDRNLSLVDALIVRNDLSKALAMLRELQYQDPDSTEVRQRLELLEEDTEDAEPLEPLPPRARQIIDQKIKRLQGVLSMLSRKRKNLFKDSLDSP